MHMPLGTVKHNIEIILRKSKQLARGVVARGVVAKLIAK